MMVGAEHPDFFMKQIMALSRGMARMVLKSESLSELELKQMFPNGTSITFDSIATLPDEIVSSLLFERLDVVGLIGASLIAARLGRVRLADIMLTEVGKKQLDEDTQILFDGVWAEVIVTPMSDEVSMAGR